jgi:DNA-directed RNA polymerase specialized sigma24 family protein
MNSQGDDDAERNRGDHRAVAARMLDYCRGDRAVFEEVYAQVAPSVFAELMAWTGDRGQAEALLDRTFQSLHQHRSAYVEGADPRPWISRMARHEFLVDRRGRCGEGQRPFWSRLRAVFTRAGTAGLEAQ